MPSDERSASLLVVDDDPDIRLLVLNVLTDEGWEVRGTETGTEALQLLQIWRPDVILLDVVLPVMSARSFRTEVDKTEAFRDIPIIVMSGVADLRQTAGALRAAAALRKPFPVEELVRVITSVSSRHRTGRHCATVPLP